MIVIHGIFYIDIHVTHLLMIIVRVHDKGSPYKSQKRGRKKSCANTIF